MYYRVTACKFIADWRSRKCVVIIITLDDICSMMSMRHVPLDDIWPLFIQLTLQIRKNQFTNRKKLKIACSNQIVLLKTFIKTKYNVKCQPVLFLCGDLSTQAGSNLCLRPQNASVGLQHADVKLLQPANWATVPLPARHLSEKNQSRRHHSLLIKCRSFVTSPWHISSYINPLSLILVTQSTVRSYIAQPLESHGTTHCKIVFVETRV